MTKRLVNGDSHSRISIMMEHLSNIEIEMSNHPLNVYSYMVENTDDLSLELIKHTSKNTHLGMCSSVHPMENTPPSTRAQPSTNRASPPSRDSRRGRGLPATRFSRVHPQGSEPGSAWERAGVQSLGNGARVRSRVSGPSMKQWMWSEKPLFVDPRAPVIPSEKVFGVGLEGPNTF